MFVTSVVLASLYWLLRPGNKTEAEDAFDFALRVREGAGPEGLVARQLLFMPLGRGLVVAADALGVTLDAYTALSLLSLVSTAVALPLFFDYLRRFRRLPVRAALAGAALLGATHGVWRYAAEADTYGLTVLAGVVLLIADATAAENPRRQPMFLALGPLILSVNLFLAIPFAVLPATRLLMQRRPFAAMRHVAISIVIGVGTAVGWFALVDPGTSFGDWLGGGSGSTGFAPSSLAKALAGAGQAALSGTFVFGFSSVSSRVTSALPLVNTTEEVFIGQHLDDRLTLLGACTAALVAIAALGLVSSAIRGEKSTLTTERESGAVDQGLLSGLLVWMVLHAAILTMSNPTAPEPWIPLLLPLATIVAGLAGQRQRSIRWLSGLALAVALHTFVGGYLPVRSATTDYNRVRSAEFTDRASADDLIVTFNSTYGRWLAYHQQSEVIDLSVLTDLELETTLATIDSDTADRRVFVTDEVVALPGYIGSAASIPARIQTEVERWGDRLVVVRESALGSLYELREQATKP